MRLFLLLILSGMFPVVGLSQDSVNIKPDIQAYASYGIFYSPEKGPYIEVYYTVKGKSITYQKQEDGKLQGTLDVTYILSKNDTVFAFDKLRLKTPRVDSLGAIDFNIVDQRRKPLPEGHYRLNIQLVDGYDSTNKTTIDLPVTVDVRDDTVKLSSIELVDRYEKTQGKNLFSKNGYDIYPHITNFYPEHEKELIFYTEIYNTAQFVEADDQYLVRYAIKKSGEDEVVAGLNRFSKKDPAPVNVVFATLNIEDLPSGNYELHIEVRNKNNEPLTHQSLFFQRSNKAVDPISGNFELMDIEDTFVDTIEGERIDYHLQAIYPIASSNEMRVIDNLLDYKEAEERKQKFFWNFWVKRDSLQPTDAYLEYMEEVKKVNKAYKTQVSYGFETDRGRVYLQYGPPNNIIKEPREPGANPYEIWYYYSLDNQSNVKFVFHNPSLATNDYVLIHSNARGEINNPRWKYEVFDAFKERNNSRNIDNTDVRDHYGSKLNDYYNE